ncbi:MAG TPA: sigma-70 family RNA polymerase sigma factor [Polyangiaceae bacterium]|jgi:RNA polymerase sigma-70 factor (ECF subfamily)|nr:sigma-70 family RNA polymerase sigma factor [Polyangiaceae bacterium]
MQDVTGAVIEGLFRREFAHLVTALTRLLGARHIELAEDVVQDALTSAVEAWRFGVPDDPKAWILQVARRRAIDALRRTRRFADLSVTLETEGKVEREVDLALSPEAEAENQLFMMFAVCDSQLSSDTRASLILRWLCGFGPTEIARAFLVDVATIERRLQRGRKRLQSFDFSSAMSSAEQLRARQPVVERALYLLFNEGYHGSDPEFPLQPAICSDALRLVESLANAEGCKPMTAHALAALFCFNSARLATRLDEQGVLVPLVDQDRARWDSALIERGIRHLAQSASGEQLTRWHLEAGIALEHTTAASVATTDWPRIVAYYDALFALEPGPVVAMNRALAVAEASGLDAGLAALTPLETETSLQSYSFYWAARADLERRGAHYEPARVHYLRATTLAKSRAERVCYERKLAALGTSTSG